MASRLRLSQYALSESAFHRYLSFGALYFAQGLPVGLFFIAIPGWLAAQGLGTAEIGGFTAFVTLPWSLKLIWGPILDRFGYLPMGRRRPWVLLAQTGLFAGLLLLSLLPDPMAHLSLLASLGFMVNVFASLQDVGVDGMAVDLLPINQRGRASGVMFGSQRVGVALAAAGGAAVLSRYGLRAAALAGAGFAALILLCPLFLRERPGEQLFPWSSGGSVSVVQGYKQSWKGMIGGVFRVVMLPASILIGVVCLSNQIGIGIWLVLLPVQFVQNLGWTASEYSQLLAIAGLVTAGSAVVLGPTLVNRLGLLRTLALGFVLEAVLSAAMYFSAPFWSLGPWVAGIVLAFAMVEGINLVATSAVFMGLCWKQVSATQFALYMSLTVNLGMAVGSGLTGPLNRVLDAPQIFLTIALIQLGICMLLRIVNLDSHRRKIEAIDTIQQTSGGGIG